MKMKLNKRQWLWMIGLLSSSLLFTVLFLLSSEMGNHSRRIASEEIEDLLPSNVEFDLSGFDGVALTRRMKFRLFETAGWIEDKNQHGLLLGNIKFKNSKENTLSLCEAYPWLELVFQAEGVVVAGDSPKIVLRTPCKSESNSEMLDPIWIPWKKIVKLKPKVRDYKENNNTFYFRSLDDFWPREWVLLELRLYPQDGGESFKVNGYEVIAVRGAPLYFMLAPQSEWK